MSLNAGYSDPISVRQLWSIIEFIDVSCYLSTGIREEIIMKRSEYRRLESALRWMAPPTKFRICDESDRQHPQEYDWSLRFNRVTFAKIHRSKPATWMSNLIQHGIKLGLWNEKSLVESIYVAERRYFHEGKWELGFEVECVLGPEKTYSFQVLDDGSLIVDGFGRSGTRGPLNRMSVPFLRVQVRMKSSERIWE